MAESSFSLPADVTRRLFVSALYHDPQLLPVVADVIEPRWFADVPAMQTLVEIARDTFQAIGLPPDPAVLAVQLEARQERGDLDEDTVSDALDVYEAATRFTTPTHMGALYPYLRQHGMSLMRRYAILDAHSQTLRAMQRGGDVDERGLERLRAAYAIGHTRNYDAVPSGDLVDPSWWGSLRERRKNPIGTGIPGLDDQVGGGLVFGEVGTFAGTAGLGKSMALVNCGVAALRDHDVLHYTLENQLPDVLARYVARITGIATPGVEDTEGWTEYREVYRDAMEVYPHRLLVRKFPVKVATLDDLEADLEETLRRGTHRPRVVIIDYAGILAIPDRYAAEKRHAQQGAIFEDLVRFAARQQVAVWTALQFNRTAVADGNPDLSQIGESYEPAKVADVVIALAQTKAEKNDPEGEVLRFLPLKVRNARIGHTIKVRLRGSTASFSLLSGQDTDRSITTSRWLSRAGGNR